MARIGGDHGGITAAGGRFEATGQQALHTASQASGHTAEAATALAELTALLEARFAETAADLRQRVTQARSQLEAADWVGASREQAEATEAALHAQVDQVLERALAGVTAFRDSARQQAERFRAHVEGELAVILRDLDAAYVHAGATSRRFAADLAAADQVIRFGG